MHHLAYHWYAVSRQDGRRINNGGVAALSSIFGRHNHPFLPVNVDTYRLGEDEINK